MPDLEDIIRAEVSKAEGVEPEVVDDNNEPEPESNEPEPEVEPEVVPESGTDEPKPGTKDEKTDDDDPELTKILEEHGLKATPKGQRENRLPYSRVRKIVANAIKKIT